MKRGILYLSSLLLFSLLALGQKNEPPINDVAGCVYVEKRLSAIESQVRSDKSQASSKHAVWTCCGEVTLYVHMKKNSSDAVLIEGWSALDAEGRQLTIESDEREVEESPGASWTTTMTRIRAKRDKELVACIFFKKFRRQ